jgi:thiamine biosynthesis lipoprotein ApbE
MRTGRGPARPGVAGVSAAGAGMREPEALGAADWQALGTQVWLLVTDPGQLAEARRLLEADLDAVDRACSRFRPDSELMRLGAAAGPAGPPGVSPASVNPASVNPASVSPAGESPPGATPASESPAQVSTTQLSPLLAEAIAVALRAARLTGGDVDPTVAGAMSALGYDRDFALLPDAGPPVRLTVRAVPGWRQVRLDEQTRLLTLPLGVNLDLGATAKAWAADRSAARLAGALGCGVLVGLGGDIAVAGPPPQGGWRIRVQDVTGRPEDPPPGPAAVVAIQEGGLATSSTTARRWRRGGDMLHHILDPRTGLPAPVYWRTVSVAAATCVDANTASTAAIIRGPQALDWLSNLGLPARLVDTAGNVRTVGGWPAETR